MVSFSLHIQEAKKSTIAAAKIILDAAVKAGAPKGIIAWIDEPSVELSQDCYERIRYNTCNRWTRNG